MNARVLNLLARLFQGAAFNPFRGVELRRCRSGPAFLLTVMLKARSASEQASDQRRRDRPA